MSSPLIKLQKFLRLESERGFDNRAVVGGLNKIIPSWQIEARSAELPVSTIETILEFLETYPNLDPQDRSLAVQKIFDVIDHYLQAPAAESSGTPSGGDGNPQPKAITSPGTASGSIARASSTDRPHARVRTSRWAGGR